MRERDTTSGTRDSGLGTRDDDARFVSAGVDADLHAADAESGVPLSSDGSPESRVPSPESRLRFTGRVDSLGAEDRRRLTDRSTSSDDAVRARTAEIVQRVRRDGDAALVALARELDRATLPSIEVPREEWRAALEGMDAGLRRAMERTIRNISTVHAAFRPKATEVEPERGIVVGRRPDPLKRVGVYAPGGRAAYPSSVFMGVVPARVAGVEQIVLCSPPSEDGLPSSVVLAAAALAEVDRVFALGGAGAIAAMAYGTATVPRVDRIVGPGNAYVAEAKLQVAGVCAIDSPAGPSELLVLADHTADPALVAREMIAQAEHDPMTAVVCVAIGDETAEQVTAALTEQVPDAERRAIVERALAGQGGVLVAQTYDEAVAFANEYAPEHLLLTIGEPEISMVLARLRNAGTVFLGETSSVAYGDYMTGANHVLPTGGLARSYSGLSTLDFVRWTTYQRVSPRAADRLAYDVGRLADAEGLPGHAAAARAWLKPKHAHMKRHALNSAAKRIRNAEPSVERGAESVEDNS
ncbi:Histidinol dehydrogenase [Gemmatirosa kalamazoonensis]|uniref:Histidinol dehydrogenase n=1 Tax=Gemmatirosa kalamazoonensis TaxID=861299 RepID=W0REQ8_9BACT|nr:histidinol dehydrogenase [Gemmatirosa kalamazoonensis]AHG88810.1 Histidinol dehydrogenase [Gemmatirosa kalamazoonensis]